MAENLTITRRCLLSALAVLPIAGASTLAGMPAGISAPLAVAIKTHGAAAARFADNCTYADCMSLAYDPDREAMHGDLQRELEQSWLDVLRAPMTSLEDVRAKGSHIARHWADMDGMPDAPAALLTSMMVAAS